METSYFNRRTKGFATSSGMSISKVFPWSLGDLQKANFGHYPVQHKTCFLNTIHCVRCRACLLLLRHIGFYRMAQAYLGMGDVDSAATAIKSGLRVDPGVCPSNVGRMIIDDRKGIAALSPVLSLCMLRVKTVPTHRAL